MKANYLAQKKQKNKVSTSKSKIKSKSKKRVCSKCQSKSTADNWRRDNRGGWLCKACYMKQYFAKKRKEESKKERERTTEEGKEGISRKQLD